MANVIYGDDLQFRALAYGAPHPGTLEFLANQFNNVSQVVQNGAAMFTERVRSMYDEFNSETAMRLTQAAIRRVTTLWGGDSIRLLDSIADFQNAPNKMVRWIMAEPSVRELYHQQRLDGYSDLYVDVHPGAVGEHHYDYRRVMDGIVVLNDDPDENTPEWYAVSYIEDLIEDDVALTLPEQVDIMDTWKAVARHIKIGGDDPTSRYNAQLG